MKVKALAPFFLLQIVSALSTQNTIQPTGTSIPSNQESTRTNQSSIQEGTLLNQPIMTDLSSGTTVLLHNFAKCTTTQRVRREIRDLTSEQRKIFLKAMLKLREDGNFDDLIHIHGNADQTEFSPSHRSAHFFPWHRLYLRNIEDRLIASGTLWPDFGLPYWDWSIDSQSPNNSIIFTADYLGANDQSSDPTKQGRIVDSPLANLISTYPKDQYVTRNYLSSNMSEFMAKKFLDQTFLLPDQTFSNFSWNFNYFPHAVVHDRIAGSFMSWHR